MAKRHITCPVCHFEGIAKRRMRGSWSIELILWCCFVVPGLIYTIWRGHSQGFPCPQCGNWLTIKGKVA